MSDCLEDKWQLFAIMYVLYCHYVGHNVLESTLMKLNAIELPEDQHGSKWL